MFTSAIVYITARYKSLYVPLHHAHATRAVTRSLQPFARKITSRGGRKRERREKGNEKLAMNNNIAVANHPLSQGE